MANDHIQRVEINGFRCLPDQEVGPFGDFNLVFGRNGSGKTSFFESIELALTGASSRIQTNEDIAQVVTRKGSASASVTVYRDEEDVMGSFTDGGIIGGPQTKIMELFGLNVTGRKASRLLPQLFRIHNVLFSETIVAFLGAEQKKGLNSALFELAAGTDVVPTWNKLDAALRHAKAITKDAETNLVERSQEVERLRSIVNELASGDLEQLEECGEQLIRKIPVALWSDGNPPAVQPFPEFLQLVNRIGPHLANTQKMLNELDKAASATNLTLWENILGVQNEAQNAVEKAHGIFDDIQKTLKADRESRESQKRERGIAKQGLSSLKARKSRLESLVNRLEYLRDWSGELRANQLSRALKAERSALNESLQDWSKLDTEVKKLPSVDSVDTKIENRKRLKKEITATQMTVTRIEFDNREVQSSLDETEVRIRNNEEHWGIAQETARDLHDQLNRILELNPESRCPACGHDWSSKKNLAAACTRHFESLSDLFGRPSDDLLTLLSARDELRGVVRETSESFDSISATRGDMKGRLREIDEELSTIVAHSNHLLDSASKIDSDCHMEHINLDSIGDRYRELPLGTIRSKYRSAKVALDRIDTRLSDMWKNLRQTEFRGCEAELEEDVSAAAAVSKSFDLSLPSNWDANEMNVMIEWSLAELSRTSQAVAEANNSLGIQEEKISSIEAGINEKRADLNSVEKDLKGRKEEYKKACHVVDLAENLASKGLIQRRGPLNLSSSRAMVAGCIEEVNYLLEEGPRFAQRLQEESQVRKELERARESESLAERRWEAAQRIEARFSCLTAPGDTEMNTLAMMADTVSEVFRRLHWPFDFKSVSFEEVDGTPEILVEPRFGPDGPFPAHQRLSSGQRAALAVSVFWALNSSRAMIPKIMMMDEPVQNIDELNALNFLDSLRWLVERGGRQIFLSTSSRRLAGLVKKKFAYLGPRFVEVELTRSGEVGEIEVRQETPRGVRAGLSGVGG